MWALARYDLGLSDDEFGASTYAQLEALIERLKEDQKKQYLRTGIIAAAIINVCGRPEKPVDPMDFVPGMEKEMPDVSKMKPEDAEKYFLNMFAKRRA